MGAERTKKLTSQLYQMSSNKTNKSLIELLLLGLMGGMSISFGALGYITLTASLSNLNVGVGKLLGAAIFPVGLILIIFLGFELFTGNCLLFVGCFGNRITSLQLLYNLLVVYIGNFIGTLFVAYTNYLSDGLNIDMLFVLEAIVQNKSLIPIYNIILKGILCNILVCGAICVSLTSEESIGKIVGMWFPVCLFVILGYEHCVANMFYYLLSICYGLDVTVSQMLYNLSWSTIGNIIGGLCLGVILYKSQK